MSYYRPSFSQTVAMSRGRGFSSPRGPSSYRGSNRGNSWGPSSRGYNSRGGGGGGGRFNSSFNSSNSYDSRNKFQGNDKYNGPRHDDYRKSYKSDSYSSGSRDHRSPDRKRLRTGSSHDRSFGGSGDYNTRYESDRRGFSSDRRSTPFLRKEEFRKPPPPTGSPRGGYRGRVSSRGNLRTRLRERPVRRRLVETSYAVRRRFLSGNSSDYARRLKISRMRSSIVRRKKETESDKEESETEEEKTAEPTEEKEASDKEGTEPEEKKVTPKKEKKDETLVSVKEEPKDPDVDAKSKSYVKLVCPHCLTRCLTFAKYSMHLQSGRHAASMRKVAMKQKSILSQMRLVQRKAQRELEKNSDELALRTSWCPLCKLNYKQPKLTHQASQAHKDMKKFLMPYCKICKVTFKSPMIYESHLCSIDHLKRKSAAAGDQSDKEGSGNEDLENFMTIDSVGDMEEEGEAAGAEKKEGAPVETKTREHINVGIENIRKVEVHYCDLCRMYLSRVTDDDEMNRIIAKHCKNRTHLQKYIRYKEDKELAKRAERLQRKETAEKEKEKVDDVKEDKDEDKKEDKKDVSPAEDEKLWADVDKDLGDILAEAGNRSSDEDEEDSVVNGERYDRFKYSEKTATSAADATLEKSEKEEKDQEPEEEEEKKLEEVEEAEAEK